MVSELFVLYCAQSNFHKLHVKLIVKLGLPILHIVGPWRPNFKDFTVLLTTLASTMLECITPNSIWENTFNSTKKYLQFDFRQSESLFKVFTSLHSIDFKSTKKYLQTRRWLEVSQKVFDLLTAHWSLAEKQQRRSEFWEMEPLKNNRHLLT